MHLSNVLAQSDDSSGVVRLIYGSLAMQILMVTYFNNQEKSDRGVCVQTEPEERGLCEKTEV